MQLWCQSPGIVHADPMSHYRSSQRPFNRPEPTLLSLLTSVLFKMSAFHHPCIYGQLFHKQYKSNFILLTYWVALGSLYVSAYTHTHLIFLKNTFKVCTMCLEHSGSTPWFIVFFSLFIFICLSSYRPTKCTQVEFSH